MILSKGDQPSKMSELKAKFSIIWNVQNCKLISIGQRFYHVLLYSDEDKKRIWAIGRWL